MRSRDDPFAGRMAPRLGRIERELAAVVVDAQARDWSADRPDRVGFARLGSVLADVRRARRRYRRWPMITSAFFGIYLVNRRGRRRAASGPAPIDDPYLYASLRRRIEACAVAARSDRNYRRRAAATDLEYALDWLAAAQEELPRRV